MFYFHGRFQHNHLHCIFPCLIVCRTFYLKCPSTKSDMTFFVIIPYSRNHILNLLPAIRRSSIATKPARPVSLPHSTPQRQSVGNINKTFVLVHTISKQIICWKIDLIKITTETHTPTQENQKSQCLHVATSIALHVLRDKPATRFKRPLLCW